MNTVNELHKCANCDALRIKLVEVASELHSMIIRENARIKSGISSTDENEPDYIDGQTVHEAMCLAKGEG